MTVLATGLLTRLFACLGASVFAPIVVLVFALLGFLASTERQV
jgi:hypothetical protein